MTDRWFEDFQPGDVFRTPGTTLTEGQIIDYAFKYDPQPFHIDKVAAEQSIYGGIIASGWHLGSVTFRLLTMIDLFGRSSLGSPGVDELRWLKPVRPGDTIRLEVSVREARPSRSKADRGIVVMDYAVKNQDDETVMTMSALQLLRRRPQA